MPNKALFTLSSLQHVLYIFCIPLYQSLNTNMVNIQKLTKTVKNNYLTVFFTQIQIFMCHAHTAAWLVELIIRV